MDPASRHAQPVRPRIATERTVDLLAKMLLDHAGMNRPAAGLINVIVEKSKGDATPLLPDTFETSTKGLTMSRRYRTPATVIAGVVLGIGSIVAPAHSDDSDVSVPGAVSPGAPMDASVFQAHRALRLHGDDTKDSLHITLSPPAETSKSAPSGGNGPLRVSFERAMPAEYEGNLNSRMKWVPFGDGTVATQASVTSPGATNMRVGIRVDLPPDAEIRFFGADLTTSYPVVTREDIYWKGFEPRTLWSPTVEGQTIGIEIILPSEESLSNFRFEIDGVLHGYLENGGFGFTPKLCSNHISATCRTSRSSNPNQIGAVARIKFRSDSGDQLVCSGTMMNDKDDRHFIPYFLTANHCISSQAEARSIEAQWYYLPATCGGTTLDSRHFTTSFGADLLETSARQDSSLLVFRNRARKSQLFSGWRANRVPIGHGAFGFSHPGGTPMKFSAGRTTRFKNVNVCEDPDAGIGCVLVANAIEVQWTEGLTEAGSSGSGLFLNITYPEVGTHTRLMGVLSGGSGGCADKVSSYGNFHDFFPQVSRYLNATTAPIPVPPYEGTVPVDDHGNTPATATTVSIPSTVRGVIDPATDSDWFRLDVSGAGRLTVRTTGSTDTIGRLFRGTSEIASDDDGGGGSNFQISLDVQAGTHYVEVRSYSSATVAAKVGAYSLDVAFTSGPPDHVLPFVLAASNSGMQSFVRIMNRTSRAGDVSISAIDDTGQRFGPISLSLAPETTVHLNSTDLERGNPAKGLHGGVGRGSGNWRLELKTEVDTEVHAYIRTADGFLTSLHEVAQESGRGSMRYELPFFNPASNRANVSWLRLANLADATATVTIWARDDLGNLAPEGSVRLTIPARAARMLSAQQLEWGTAADAQGRWGDGAGKWKLSIAANRPLQVMSIMRTASGNLTNLTR